MIRFMKMLIFSIKSVCVCVFMTSILRFISYIFTLSSQPGKFLAILPVDPKLGKMLIMGAIFRCFDPVLTIVAGLSVRDPFLLPQDKKDVSRKQLHH